MFEGIDDRILKILIATEYYICFMKKIILSKYHYYVPQSLVKQHPNHLTRMKFCMEVETMEHIPHPKFKFLCHLGYSQHNLKSFRFLEFVLSSEILYNGSSCRLLLLVTDNTEWSFCRPQDVNIFPSSLKSVLCIVWNITRLQCQILRMNDSC